MEQKNKRLMIFLAGEIRNKERISALIRQNDFDFYAADAGYLHALEFGVPLQEVFGDFDSMPRPNIDNIRVFPTEKDQTDSEIALDLAIQNGYREVWMIAPFGGRLDHTYANLCLLEKATAHQLNVYLYDGENQACLLKEGINKIKAGQKYYSFFPWKERAVISLRGFKYALDHYELLSEQPLAISNESNGNQMEIEVHKGIILYISVQ